jgi:hypothetical protein
LNVFYKRFNGLAPVNKANKYSIRITDDDVKEVIRLTNLFGPKGARSKRKPMGFPPGLIDQSGSMPATPMTGAGKTEVAKAMAKAMGIDIVTLDMAALKDPGDLDKLLGHPAGYQGFDSDESLLGRAMADIRAVARQQEEAAESARNGEALAAECRGGIGQPASPMKVLRLRGARNMAFALTGRISI